MVMLKNCLRETCAYRMKVWQNLFLATYLAYQSISCATAWGGDSIICIVKAGGIVCANVINVCTAFNTWLCNMVPTEELAARRDELSRAKSALYATRSRLENKLSTPKT